MSDLHHDTKTLLYNLLEIEATDQEVTALLMGVKADLLDAMAPADHLTALVALGFPRGKLLGLDVLLLPPDMVND